MINKEKLLAQFVRYREATTTDATTPVLLVDYEPPDGFDIHVVVEILGVEPIAPVCFEKTRRAAFRYLSGTLTQCDTTQTIAVDCQDLAEPTEAGTLVKVSADGKRIEATGLGRGTDTLHWSSWMYISLGPVY